MAQLVLPGPILTILAGQVLSTTTLGDQPRAKGFHITAPATLTNPAFIETYDGAAWTKLTSNGEDIELPAGRGVAIRWNGWDDLRIGIAAAELTNKAFRTRIIEED